MNLKEFQEKYNIRRINFDKVKPVEYDDTYATDELTCPYCLEDIEYDAEDIDSILSGTSYQCPVCENWFRVSGETAINTTCVPIENAVLDSREEIEAIYEHVDKCEAAGIPWENPYGNVEYETYKEYAEPLFENMELDREE